MRKGGLGLLLLLISLSACGGPTGGGGVSAPTEGEQHKTVLELVSQDWPAAIDSLHRWTTFARGYFLYKERRGEQAYFCRLRIPLEEASAFLVQVSRLGERLSEYHTALRPFEGLQYLQSRLQMKEEAIQRLRALLQNARTASDILAIEQELQRALAEYAALRDTLYQRELEQRYLQVEITLYNPYYLDYFQGGSYLGHLKRSVAEGWRGFIQFTFWLAELWWVWLLSGLGWGLWRWWRRRKC
ncbi:MAG: DUF4349 domain-containing protein [Bacteroidia bacterium]|nr:DUF4349 domain-containing protein [Bacteroidia bacterium]MDW8088335.1 DUF4349 domain-containing protein [Bacteroidia bacterium]